jgi:hypothetical protein
MTARFARTVSSQLLRAALAVTVATSIAAVGAPAALAAPPAAPASTPLSQVLTGAARDDYESAKLVYAEGDFVTAAIKFRRAYDVSRDPRLLWNIAACEKGAHHYTKALELVERYQAEGASLLTEADRQEANGFASALRATTDTITVTANVGDAVVSLDGVMIGKTPIAKPVRVDLGERRLLVSKVGYQPYEQLVSFTGKGVALTVTLQEMLHEGTLRIDADPDAAIAVDGQLIASGGSALRLASGAHNVHVSAKGKKTYDSDVVVQDGQTNTVRVRLESEKSGVGPWPWLIGGAVVVAGGVLATYFAVHNSGTTKEGTGTCGTLGCVQLTK